MEQKNIVWFSDVTKADIPLKGGKNYERKN